MTQVTVPSGIKVKKATKPKTAKVQEVPDVERLFPFKHSPIPDIPGLDFHVDQFMVPMVNIPYSLEYLYMCLIPIDNIFYIAAPDIPVDMPLKRSIQQT